MKFFAALRHSEASGGAWEDYDAATRPLGAVNLGKTKTDAPRPVPVHATLARMLAAWKLAGWVKTYGRPPRAEDLIVPTRQLRRRKPADPRCSSWRISSGSGFGSPMAPIGTAAATIPAAL